MIPTYPTFTADGKFAIITKGKKYSPLGNNIIIGFAGQSHQAAPGIWRAPSYADDRKMWYVLAVGPGKRNRKGILIPPAVKVGDKILTDLHFSHQTLEDGSNRKIINADQIVAIIP